jgi:hypothetical protein
MVVKMLEDLAVDAKVIDWTLRRVATSYLSDDRASSDWRDIWLVTGLVDIRVANPVRPVESAGVFGHTTAWDETWTRRTPPPDQCLIVADFAKAEQAREVVELFDMASSSPGPAQLAEAIGQALPGIGDTDLRWLAAALEQDPPVAERCDDPLQVHVRLHADPRHFEEAAARATRAETFLHTAGATTNWRDRRA